MRKKLFLLSGDLPDPDMVNLAKMADFFGVEQIDEPPDSYDYSIVVSQKNLELLSGIPPARSVLIYDCCRDNEEFSVAPSRGDRFHVGKYREFTRQLSGLSISTPVPADCHVFTGAESTHVLLRLGDDPFFIHENKNGCDWFYLGGNTVANLDDPVKNKLFSLDKVFAELIPFAIFFQHLCPPRRYPVANLIIDDPSLRGRYGFIDYKEVASLLPKVNFALTIAFIPWNYRKSVSQTIALFADNADRLSICVHGCDHTASEFGSQSERVLNGKASLARKRMEDHKRRFGLPYDNVMVFPQGVFSEESMPILKEHGFLAAVNSGVIANNYRGGLKIRDLMSAATCHYGLPLLLRRYPAHIEHFAFDLFFGRPALIVQHSADFAEGWDEILAFISNLNKLEPDLRWLPLGRLVQGVCPSEQGVALQGKGKAGDYRYTPSSYLKTALRRHLCDMRDNVVLRNRFLRFLLRQ